VKAVDIVIIILCLVVAIGILYATIAPDIIGYSITNEVNEMIANLYSQIISIIALWIGTKIKQNENY
jgi:hypothetical protein